MIKATPGWTAVFRTTTGSFNYDPVIAWDDEGCALIVDRSRGHLVRALSEPGFMHLTEDNDPPAITAIPGQGWQIQVNDSEGTWEYPVVAFTLDARGGGAVIAAAADGLVLPEDDIDGTVKRLVPPGGWNLPTDSEEK